MRRYRAGATTQALGGFGDHAAGAGQGFLDLVAAGFAQTVVATVLLVAGRG